MDRIAGVLFSLALALIGWAFAPFDKLPHEALYVSITLSALGLSSAIYCLWRR